MQRERGGRIEGWKRRELLSWGQSGGVWNRSSRWSGEQRSEAQERSLCSGCCLSAGSSVVCLHVSHVLSVRRPVWTTFPFSAARSCSPLSSSPLSSHSRLLVCFLLLYLDNLQRPGTQMSPTYHLPFFCAYLQPKCDGTYHLLGRRCDGMYQHACQHNYRHTMSNWYLQILLIL